MDRKEVETIIAKKIDEHVKSCPCRKKGKKDKATLAEIEAYIQEKKYKVDAEAFYASMVAKNWERRAGEPVRNWKGTIYQAHVGEWYPPRYKRGGGSPLDAPCEYCGGISNITVNWKPFCGLNCSAKYEAEKAVRIRRKAGG